MLKDIVKKSVPPYVLEAYRRIYSTIGPEKDKNILFEGEDAMFKRSVENARLYGEYGCGASTVWVSGVMRKPSISVDTSLEWIHRVEAELNSGHEANLVWVNLGATTAWGRPSSYDKRADFSRYLEAIWDIDSESPDLILIDGRFRVACFLTCLVKAAAGTSIIFDDYFNRRRYHIVENFICPVESCGRQAKFVVPPKGTLNVDEVKSMLEDFRFVMD